MTWLPVSTSRDESEAAQIFALQPETTDKLREFLEVAADVSDAELLALARTRMAQMLRCRALLDGQDSSLLDALANWPKEDRFGVRERAVLDFTEQFVISAVDVSGEQGAELAKQLGVSEPSTFVYGLQINEGLVRLLAFLDVAPDPEGGMGGFLGRVVSSASGSELAGVRDLEHLDWVDPTTETDPRLLEAYHAFARAACRKQGIDALTSELVRLRSAVHHQCQFCQSVRRDVEVPDGVDDLMSDAMNFERSGTVDERQRTCLRILEVFITDPASVERSLQADALQQLSPESILELLLKEMFWMSNKPMISLGTDPGPVDASKLTPFVYDEEGNFTLLVS
jgi:alkylhydroperoxidase family enzyme